MDAGLFIPLSTDFEEEEPLRGSVLVISRKMLFSYQQQADMFQRAGYISVACLCITRLSIPEKLYDEFFPENSVIMDNKLRRSLKLLF